ncbi:hypothetical protein LOTGIDRAFT_158322 [Lottia gigantea]|uniref:Etoposide-induced protein 2.4 homolog n=1 Tax=Lottia gigantea TaxID=225164 RepID=V4B1B9_LOTGI|nr:hypothetical protein LOTGIDRAFT_158322 [Lottia gigantea]ESP00092.1 hypothetical protein LOTGIDRAFT_158322 [Lottia gigantea]
MGDTFKNTIENVAWGFKDCVFGMVTCYRLDTEFNQAAESQRPAPEPMTTLAKRRAERLKHTEVFSIQVFYYAVLPCILYYVLFQFSIQFSIQVFYYVVLPCIFWMIDSISGLSGASETKGSWLAVILSFTFDALWILPLFVLSKILNCFWFQDIADAVYVKRHGKPQLPNISTFVADMSFSLFLQALFLIQAMLIKLLPIYGVGQIISLIHMCLLYSLYAFEYKWFNKGVEVHTRLSLIERNWAYFTGFGLPLAVLTTYVSSSMIVSGYIFSILFPLVIISANEAVEPTVPFDFPLKLFAPVVSISNSVFNRSFSKRVRNTSGQHSS